MGMSCLIGFQVKTFDIKKRVADRLMPPKINFQFRILACTCFSDFLRQIFLNKNKEASIKDVRPNPSGFVKSDRTRSPGGRGRV